MSFIPVFCLLLGLIYRLVLNLHPSWQGPRKSWYEKAVVGPGASAAVAAHHLATLVSGSKHSGDQVSKEEMIAQRRWYKQAATYGIVQDQGRYGLSLARGDGGPVNRAEALRWLRKAAKAGDAISQTNLAVELHRDEDIDSAMKWFRKAAVQNQAYACSSLAHIFLERAMSEESETLDLKEAAKWFAQGAGLNHVHSMVCLVMW